MSWFWGRRFLFRLISGSVELRISEEAGSIAPVQENEGRLALTVTLFAAPAPGPLDSQHSLPTKFSRLGFPGDPHAGPLGVGGLGEACGHMRRPRGVARALIFSSVRDLQLLFLGEFG